jgi:hypothetical protein
MQPCVAAVCPAAATGSAAVRASSAVVTPRSALSPTFAAIVSSVRERRRELLDLMRLLWWLLQLLWHAGRVLPRKWNLQR